MAVALVAVALVERVRWCFVRVVGACCMLHVCMKQDVKQALSLCH